MSRDCRCCQGTLSRNTHKTNVMLYIVESMRQCGVTSASNTEWLVYLLHTISYFVIYITELSPLMAY